MAYKVMEITKENYSQYIEPILKLRKQVVSEMISNGLSLDNEISDKDCVNSIESDKCVFLAIVDEKGDVKAISIINKGQADNVWSIDSCMTDKDVRGNGLARILLFEGLKREMTAYFENPDNNELTLLSSFSKDNISIEAVMDSFEFYQSNALNESEKKEHLTVKKKYKDDYLKRIEERIAVIYGYNPRKINISNKRKMEILEEKVDYDMFNTRKHGADFIAGNTKGKKMIPDLEEYLSHRIRRRLSDIFDLQRRISNLKKENEIDM